MLRNQQNVKHITEVRPPLFIEISATDSHPRKLNSLLADRISQAESEIAARQRLEEQVTRTSRELRDAKARGGSGMGSGPIESSSASGGSRELQELKRYSEDLAVRSPFPPLRPGVDGCDDVENAQVLDVQDPLQISHHQSMFASLLQGMRRRSDRQSLEEMSDVSDAVRTS